MVKQAKAPVRMLLMLAVVLTLCLLLLPVGAHADPPYTRNAALKDSANYPGVYYVSAVKGDSNATIGIPSLAKQTLTAPTTESPAIEMGAALPYEKRIVPTVYEPLPGATLYPPYSYFRYKLMPEVGPDGTQHNKISGFDGTYVIIRVDVSDIIKDAPAGSWLHVKHTGNKALMAVLSEDPYGGKTIEEWISANGKATFSDALGNQTGVYRIDGGAVSMKDKEGNDNSTPYIDVIVYSSGTLVAGAETGGSGAQSADFTLEFYVDQTQDYNPGLKYDPNATSTTTPTHAEQMMAKFFDKTKVAADAVTGYTIKGNDLELEVKHPSTTEGGKTEYWGLRKAMEWKPYNDSAIMMICEVPVLEGLKVEGTAGENRHVIFDVNSFDIQIANHQTTGTAGLMVKNAKLTLMDSCTTTGAELAVGNNATMTIQTGGILVIDKSCQVEVEYDAASVTPGTDPPAQDLNFGVITIESGGQIINNGVISIEGTEGKPIDPAAPAVRDKQAAEFHIQEGGKLTNNGALLAFGALYNLGTIENNGKYDDVITSKDPDKGIFTYHSGIQVSWKDDVTQQGVYMGHFYNGIDRSDAITAAAKIINNGDIVLMPGFLENYGTLTNAGTIHLGAIDEAVIPVAVTWSALIIEERISFERPIAVYLTNYKGATFQNTGKIDAAKVEIIGSGRSGKLTPFVPEDLSYDICVNNFGQMANSGSIVINGIYNFGAIDNTSPIQANIVLKSNLENEPVVTDTAGLTEVFNAVRTTEGNVNTWRRAGCAAITVTPGVQYGQGGKTVNWTVKAETKDPAAEGVRYYLYLYQGNSTSPVKYYIVKANQDNLLQSPALPEINGNTMYKFWVDDGLESASAEASVKLTSTAFTPPAAIKDLVYNGQDQALVTNGDTQAETGTVMYRLGESGEWSNNVPVGKNAGSYKVYYKLSTEAEDAQPAYVDAVIAKRTVTVSGNDVSSQVGKDLAELSWTVSGLLEGETLEGVQIKAGTDANKDAVGVYKVTVAATGEHLNYTVTTRESVYTVTQDDFTVVAKDKYGVFSDETTYKGFNIELTVPTGATAYYSTSVALTKDNYSTAGMNPLKNLPAAAGTHTVYFYVTNGTSAVSGSKQVIIDKAKQKAPDTAKLITRSETWKYSEDGIISGLTPYKMEYRDKFGSGIYSLAYTEQVFVRPGTYLVRMAADANHYASPDVEVTVAEGPTITVSFNSNGSSTAIPDATGLACGDTVPEPTTKPTLEGWTFLGWYRDGKPYDFNKPVAFSTVVYAGWEPNQEVSFTLPTGATVVDESTFEGTAAIYVVIPDGYTTIQPNAFKGCSQLKYIRIPATVEQIGASAFDGCSGVYVIGKELSKAETMCQGSSNFTFIIGVDE